MNKEKNDSSEPLEKKVRSKIKGLGLDALFHLVDVNQKDQDIYNTKDGKPFQRINFFHEFKQSSLKFVRGKLFQISGVSVLNNKISTVLGIYIGTSTIKLIQFKLVQNKVQLSFLKNIDIPHIVTATREKYEEFVLDALSQVQPKIFKESFVCALMPRHKAILKFVQLPTTKNNEINKMLHFEAEHLLPFPLEELEYDFSVVKKEESHTEILLAAIKKDEIEQFQDLTRKAGIRVQAIDLTAMSVLNGFQNEIPHTGTHIQVRLGADSTDINVLVNGQLKVSRGIQWGSRILTQSICNETHVDFEIAEQSKKDFGIILRKSIDQDVAKSVSDCAKSWADALLEEIEKTMQQVMMQAGTSKIDHLSLYGGGAQIANLDEYLKEKMEIKVTLPAPPANIEIISALEPSTKTFPEITPLFGIAQRLIEKSAFMLNLLPDKLKRAEHRRRLILQRTTIIGLFVCVCVAFVQFPPLLLSLRESRIKNLDKKIVKLDPEVRTVSKTKERVNTINNYFSLKRSSMEILREISMLVSLDIIVKTFSFDKNNSVILVGEALSHRSVVELSGLIRESSLFDDAVLKYSNKRDRTQDNVDFEIVCKLSPK